jgi:hypothetical protein
MDLFAKLGVDLVLGGHMHRAYIGNSLDVYPGEDRERGIIIVQAGTATSRRGRAREREKNSFNFIQTDGAMIDITHYMFYEAVDAARSAHGRATTETDLGEFAPASRHTFPRPGLRWAAKPVIADRP